MDFVIFKPDTEKGILPEPVSSGSLVALLTKLGVDASGILDVEEMIADEIGGSDYSIVKGEGQKNIVVMQMPS